MLVSVDGGGLCTENNNRFGNFIFSKNLIEALGKFDKQHQYLIYSFCDKAKELHLSSNVSYKKILPRRLWLSGRLSVEELFSKKDIFLALNQAVPFTRSKKIAFSHGLSFLFYKDLYKNSYDRLTKQLNQMISKADEIIVSSAKVAEEFNSFFPAFKPIIIPYGIPFDYLSPNNQSSIKIKDNFFMFAGINHSIKNIKFIVDAFKVFKSKKKYSNYSLYLVGEFKEFESPKEKIFSLGYLERNELKKMYRKAAGYLTASLYESFNLPVLEALANGCQVIGLETAVVPELRKYVHQANNFDAFLQAMNNVAQGKIKAIDFEKLQKEFSWKNYVEQLINLY